MLSDTGNIFTVVLAIFTLASILGTAAAIFYSVRQRTVITILKESNDAYKDRNAQLESQTVRNTSDITALKNRIVDLEKIKTSPLEPLIALVTKNHTEVMTVISKRK